MYALKTIKAVKVSSFRDYVKGSVLIDIKKEVKLNPSYYNKRKGRRKKGIPGVR